MRPAIFLFASICFLVGGCDPTASHSERRNETLSKPAESSTQTDIKPTDTISSKVPADLEQLTPLAELNPGSKDVFERFGIDFSGNCYECDLATIGITKNSIELVNVCNKDDKFKNEKAGYRSSGDTITVNFEQTTLIFTRVDPAPVYELKQTGNKLSLKNKKLAKFYTYKNMLIKFKQHECGEFDG